MQLSERGGLQFGTMDTGWPGPKIHFVDKKKV